MIRFKDSDGRECEVMIRWTYPGARDPIVQLAGTDDFARAFHAMTDDQVLEMAKAYGRLPRLGGMRSFDEAFVREPTRIEAQNVKLRKALGRLIRSAGSPPNCLHCRAKIVCYDNCPAEMAREALRDTAKESGT